MQLTSPIVITPRLLPGVKIGDAFISIRYAKRPGDDNRTRYQYYIDPIGPEDGFDDLQSGCQGGDLQAGLESLLSFLGACGESYGYAQRTGRGSENSDLFPPAISEWAYQNSDELSMLAIELEETPGLIDE